MKKENVVEKELFKKRILESDIFNKEEQEKIERNYFLYRKCYCLGILDKASSNYN